MHVDSGVDETINFSSLQHEPREELFEKKQETQTSEKKNLFMSPNELVGYVRKLVDNIDNINHLQDAVENFDGCSICKTATKTVFSDGVASSEVMVIGEAPGANEDMKGIPFCGDSGQLLDKVLSSIELHRAENVYITNTVFWRPPGNRRPTDEELRICQPFVEKHIALIRPKIIILVGSTASQALLGDLGPVSKQRMRVFEYTNCYLDYKVPCVVTFHPSYLLRQPSQKRAAWQDMLFIKKILNS